MEEEQHELDCVHIQGGQIERNYNLQDSPEVSWNVSPVERDSFQFGHDNAPGKNITIIAFIESVLWFWCEILKPIVVESSHTIMYFGGLSGC